MLASSEPMLPTDAVDHFSYGANTASSTLAKRGVEVLASRPAMLVDPGMAISFRHRGGFATLIREPPRDGTDPRLQRGNVHGVLYTLSKPDLAALQRAETGYTLEAVRVCTYPPAAAPACTAAALGSMGSSEESRSAAGSLAIAISRSEATSQDRAVLATAFVSRPMLRLRHPVPPTEQYLKLLKAGAREHGLDSAYVAWLASVPSVDRPGLPPAYFDTESNTVAQGFLVLVALATVCIYWPHKEHTQPFVADTNIPVVASDSDVIAIGTKIQSSPAQRTWAQAAQPIFFSNPRSSARTRFLCLAALVKSPSRLHFYSYLVRMLRFDGHDAVAVSLY